MRVAVAKDGLSRAIPFKISELCNIQWISLSMSLQHSKQVMFFLMPFLFTFNKLSERPLK